MWFILGVDSDNKDGTHIQNDLLYIRLFTDLLAGRLIRYYLNVDTIAFKWF